MNEPGAEPVTDSPYAGVAQHVARYLASDGRDGHMAGGVPNLVLTTRGRKSGKLRRTAVFYTKDGERYVLIASHMSGGPKHPDWYLNLVANPEVHVQAGSDKFTARARTADAGEKPRLWALMTKLWPDFDTYQATASREIPVVVLERV
ncbi:nitroreductase family deazaflavin-dependent oxidoreductase [Saccharothrix sp.]|uniref:nitroreductase family deazaflavin-dependent oxidoreductase n=1 Tax=Saccharothrix sp. TaxID=1873460 RepID=UPI0028120B20|nr:nitroreductase family deazaflavin-dependent oxidoreductase [Saccharothrix sp.]